MQTIYQVSVAPFSVNTSQQQNLGFIDNVKPAQYLAQAAQPANFTLAQSQAKSQGNLRWFFIQQSLALMSNPYVMDVDAVGATLNSDATSFTFNVYFERDSAVTTADANGNVLNGAAAVQYAVAAALASTQTFQTEYYDPTTSTSYQNGTQTAAFDYCDQRVGNLVVGALAASASAATSNITVTVLSQASW